MANKIQLRRGLSKDLPTLAEGEPGFTTDTKKLYVGTSGGNANLTGITIHRGTDLSGTEYGSTVYSYSYFPTVKTSDLYLNIYTGGLYYCSSAPEGKKTQASWKYIGPAYGARILDNTGVAKSILTILGPLVSRTLSIGRITGTELYTTYETLDSSTLLNKVYYMPRCYQNTDVICNSSGSESITLRMYGDSGLNGVTIEENEAAMLYLTKIDGALQAIVLMKAFL